MREGQGGLGEHHLVSAQEKKARGYSYFSVSSSQICILKTLYSNTALGCKGLSSKVLTYSVGMQGVNSKVLT